MYTTAMAWNASAVAGIVRKSTHATVTVGRSSIRIGLSPRMRHFRISRPRNQKPADYCGWLRTAMRGCDFLLFPDVPHSDHLKVCRFCDAITAELALVD